MFNLISSLGTSFMAHLFCIIVEYKMYKMFNKALPKTCWTITNYFVNLMIISHRVKNIITNFIKMLFYFTIISIMTMYSFLGHPFFRHPPSRSRHLEFIYSNVIKRIVEELVPDGERSLKFLLSASAPVLRPRSQFQPIRMPYFQRPANQRPPTRHYAWPWCIWGCWTWTW